MWIFLNPSIRAARVAPAVFARRLSYFPYRQSFVKLGAVRRVDCQNKVPSFLSRQLSVSVEPPPEVEDAAADNNSRGTRPSPGTRYQPNSETLEERVIRLGDQIKRYDRVQIGQLKVLLGEARKIDTLDDPVALLLLRCTGSILAREQPAVRQELFLQAWDLVKSRASLNTSHYNAAMRVMIENEEEFDPTQFLAEMDQSPTTKPNRVTYQVMVAKYCASGDTDAAFKIINHMKTTGMPVNEYIFSSLIKAFVKNGEPEQAREVMNNMRSASLEPSDITYRAILTAYAELGNLDAIHQTLAEAKKDDVLIKAGVIPELGTTAVLSGHNDLLEPILDLLSSQGRYNLNLSNCADKLVSYGHDEEAYLMISKMQFTQVQEPGQLGHGKALIGAMIQCDRPAEKIVEIQKRLNDTGLNTDTVEDILQRSLINGKTNLAVDLMDIIRKEGNTVAHEDIISLSRNFVKGKDGEGLYDVAREITKTLDGDRQAISLYLNVVRELLKQEPLDTIVERLKEVGVGEEVIKMLSIAARMSEVPVSEVVRDAEPEDIKPSIIKLDVFNIIRGSNGSAEEIMLLIDTLNRSSRDQMVQIQSIVLLRCLQSLAMSDEECKKLVDLMHERQLGIMRPMQDNILMQVDKMNLSPEIVNEIKTKLQELYSLKIESVSRIVKPEDMRQMSIEDLEKLQREQKRKGFNNKSTQKRLLIAHCKEGNIAEADKIMDSLKQQGFIFDAETLRQLLMYFAEHKQDVKEAERHLELLESQYPDFWQYTGALIHMARLYLRQNNLEAAKELLKSRAMKHQEKYDAEFRTCFVLGRRLQDLLTDAANNCGGKAAQELLPILFESGYIKEGSYDLIKMPVESCIRKGDFDGALDNLEHTLKEYNRVPGFSAIFIHFIKEENSEKLQRAVDLCMSSNLDQFSVLHHLMFGFIESGKLKQARNIAETPGLRANMTLLKDHCTRLAVAGKLQQIHDMVEATRNLDGVDKEELHFQLIRANSSKGDWQKALDAYIFMEEEGITPRVRTQRYLANVLQSAGQPVPFQVPEPKQSTNAPGKTSGNEDILEAIKKDDYETLLKLTNKSENTGSQSASAEIASLLVQSKQVRLLKKVVHELAMRGECDKISQIASVPLPVNMKKYCSQKTFLAQITKGTVDKFFEDVQKDLKIFVNSSTGVNMKELLNARPEMLQTVEDLAVKATADPGTYGPLGDLAHALFVLRQDEKFSELIQKYPDVKENLQFQNLTRTLRNQEEDMKRLAEFSQKHLTIGKYKSCMSNLILMRAMENDVDGALKYFEEVQNLGIKPEEMWAKPMMMVETLLRDKGQSLPWPEGTFKPRDQGITSRSSSSSSSSNSSSSSSSSSSNPSSSSDDSSSSDSSDDESSKKRK